MEEPKKSTTCADCGLSGHWKGDKECKGPKRAHVAVTAEEHVPEEYEEEYGGQEYWENGKKMKRLRLGWLAG